MYPLVVVGIVIMLVLPRVTNAVPAPLVAVGLRTIAVVVFGWSAPIVGGQGELPNGQPVLGVPTVPFTFGPLRTIAPYAIAMALVGMSVPPSGGSGTPTPGLLRRPWRAGSPGTGWRDA